MFSDPEKNLKAFGLKENDIVADLGAGTGYYTVAAGKMVPRGKVYAVEVVKDFLTTIKSKALDEKLSNVECIWGDIEKPGGTKLGDGIIDAAIASNILFQVERKDRFIDEINRILKKGGKVLLVDWIIDKGLTMPVAKLKNAVPKEKALELFTTVGFKLEREIDAGANHYGMILVKN
jgi:ubiquinone/menaquinone biosynthesis C-methylase UbiE